jgi:membrane protease YdiL (CAAX protease family)
MALFWLLSFGLAWAITVPLAASQLGILEFSLWPAQTAILIGVAPAIAASVSAARSTGMVTLWKRGLRLTGRLWLWGTALSLPPLLLGFRVIAARIGLAEAPAIAGGPEIAVFAIVWLLLALGEEIGWRGFALPRLVAVHGFWRATTLLGLMWCVWHFPRLLASPYVVGLHEALPLIGLFSVQILFANIIICWLARRAGYSVVLPTIFHAGFNVVATVYPEAAIDPWITGAIALVAMLIAIFDRELLRRKVDNGVCPC